MEAYSREPKEEGLLRIIKNKIITPENFQMILLPTSVTPAGSNCPRAVLGGLRELFFEFDHGHFWYSRAIFSESVHGHFTNSWKLFWQFSGTFSFQYSRAHAKYMLNIHKHLCENDHGYIFEVYGKKKWWCRAYLIFHCVLWKHHVFLIFLMYLSISGSHFFLNLQIFFTPFWGPFLYKLTLQEKFLKIHLTGHFLII